MEPFTPEWAAAWHQALLSNRAYQDAAARWEGAVALVRTDPAGAERRVVFLDLWHGECRAARMAEPGDFEAARYALEADRATWEELLRGDLPPLPALMSGRLRLTRGNFATLLPFAAAARELVATAVAMGGVPPTG